ncbi:MAG: hypothetical protein LW840_03675 [Gemmatimonas sp.]|jgi:hypothetical protein|uniref:hypothetical protein n=1 Tax=Gemmatimonas sp. TaxID=1962908 RepID=UPI0025C416CC|nr:hypothetical protein [Gemmatimonas sp.]MCE2952782.1 hypothetical protein [Gemmatimonas sp.]
MAVAVILPALALAPLGAQAPSVSVTKVTPVRAVEKWPGMTLVADQDAHTVVVAVTRGPRQTAVQVLSPVAPTRASSVRRGKRLPVRSLQADELAHLTTYGSRPLILAFASSAKPNLDAFVQQNRWAPDMVLDTAVTSVQEVIGVLGRELFDEAAVVSVTVAEAASPVLLSAQANAFTFVESCGNGAASSVPSGNVSYTGALGIVGYPDFNWGAGKLISGQSFKIIPARSVGSACIDARMALFPMPTPGTPRRPVPANMPAAAELKMPPVSDKPVEAIPAHMAPGPVVNPPAPKPPR